MAWSWELKVITRPPNCGRKEDAGLWRTADSGPRVAIRTEVAPLDHGTQTDARQVRGGAA